MSRIVAFIDGFNMYHSIDGLRNDLKWLNYWELANAFVKKSDRLVRVLYFSAIATWDQGKVKRHNDYIKALQSVGVEAVLGKFKRVTRKCRNCRQQFQTFEEKETDVNIAIHLLKLAFKDEYDVALLFSGDSDLIPAVKSVRTVAPHKEIKVVIPYGRSSEDLKKHCDGSARIRKYHLEGCQFSDPLIVDSNKGISIAKPGSWK